MKRIILITVFIFCFGVPITITRCTSPIDESYYLIRVQVYGQFSDRIGPKTSLLIMDNLNKLQVNSDSILLMQEKSGIRSQIVYYLQSSGAYVLDFDPEHSVIHGCCYFGDSGYVDAQDSLVSVATDPYPIDESKFRSFEICGMPNKVIIGMSRINAAAARCKEIKSLAQEINYIDSISYLCKIKEVHMVGDGELQYLNGKLSRLDQGCD